MGCSPYTVWQEDIDLAYKPSSKIPELSIYKKLIAPAAYYTYWKVCQSKYPRKANEYLRENFATNILDSYILTQIGTQIQSSSKDYDLAEKTLRKAIQHDHNNAKAWFNLAMIEFREADDNFKKLVDEGVANEDDQADYGRTVEYLTKVIKLTNKSKYSIPYILAKYNLGLIELYKYLHLENNRRSEWWFAIKYIWNPPGVGNIENAQSFFEEALKAAKALKNNDKIIITDELLNILQIVASDAKILVMQAYYKFESKNDPCKKIKQIENTNYIKPKVLYSLACHHSLMRQFNIIKTEKAYDNALRYLEDAFSTNSGLASYAEQHIVLKKLRDEKLDEFNLLINKFSPQPSKESSTPIISQLQPIPFAFIIGHDNAKRLQLFNPKSNNDLLHKVSKRDQREKLAEKCAISQNQLLLLAQSLELMQTIGVDEKQLNLLNAASISSLEKLKNWDTNRLALSEKLNQVKQKLELDIEIPASDKLSWWIEKAKSTQSLVEP